MVFQKVPKAPRKIFLNLILHRFKGTKFPSYTYNYEYTIKNVQVPLLTLDLILSKVLVCRSAEGMNHKPRLAFFSDDFAARVFSFPSRLYSTSKRRMYESRKTLGWNEVSFIVYCIRDPNIFLQNLNLSNDK